MIRTGSDLQYDANERLGSGRAQLRLACPRDVTLKTGYSIGFVREDEDFARIAVDVEF